MKLIYPIKDITDPIAPGPWSIYISQKFGNVWIADRDMTINGKAIKKGDNVYLKVFGMVGHNGIDIAAPRFTPVFAPCDGYIVEADGGAGYGNRVILFTEEGDSQYMQVFGHLDNWLPLPKIDYNLKYRGKPVKQGDKIGEVDSTGFSTGDHLHWGMYLYKNYVKQNSSNGYQGAIDPAQFLKGKDSMQLIKDNGTVYLVAGVNNKVKLGIADQDTLALFGDEPVTETSTSGINQTYTISTGFILNKK